MSIILQGSTSGSITLQEPAIAGTTTLNLPTISGPVGVLVSGTAVASTSGTSIDFTGIPAGVRRITVMFSGVSTSGTSLIQAQIGSGSFTTTGYLGGYGSVSLTTANTTGGANFTTGCMVGGAVAAATYNGTVTITNVSNNVWVFQGSSCAGTTGVVMYNSASGITLGGVLDRIRITTVNGTDTFDAGSINILYE